MQSLGAEFRCSLEFILVSLGFLLLEHCNVTNFIKNGASVATYLYLKVLVLENLTVNILQIKDLFLVKLALLQSSIDKDSNGIKN